MLRRFGCGIFSGPSRNGAQGLSLLPPRAQAREHSIQKMLSVKVHLTPKYFFRSNKSLHLFETHYAFLPLFIPNLDFLQAVKVTKSGHHLLYDRASKVYASIPGLTSQTSLHACLQRLKDVRAQKFPRTDFFKLSLQVENDKIRLKT